jgi:hypothetical protein
LPEVTGYVGEGPLSEAQAGGDGRDIALVVLGAAQDETILELGKDILSILLPVLSVWAGTVLAFYFSRENYESAARHSSALVRQLTSEEKLEAILIQEVMIPIGKATKLILDKPEDGIKLKADMIDALLDKEKRERLPMLDPQGCIRYIAHRSLIDRFIVRSTAAGKALADLTLADMLADSYCHEVMTDGFQTLRADETLAQAKAWMDKVEFCADVFATEDGTPQTRVIGWVTNAIVREQAMV